MTSGPKTFSLTLTEAQYLAIEAAVKNAEETDRRAEPLDPIRTLDRAVRLNAMNKLKSAFYGDRAK